VDRHARPLSLPLVTLTLTLPPSFPHSLPPSLPPLPVHTDVGSAVPEHLNKGGRVEHLPHPDGGEGGREGGGEGAQGRQSQGLHEQQERCARWRP